MQSFNELSNISGRVSVVTGADGHVGRILSKNLALAGSNLFLIDLDGESLDRFARSLFSDYGVNVRTHSIDLEEIDSAIKIVQEIKVHFSCIDILINNAAFVGTSTIDGWSTDFEHQSIPSWRRALEVNVTQPFALIQACAPLLRESVAASIINIASIYGFLGPDFRMYEGTGMSNPAAYSVSKAGLIQLTKWLATALAPNIRVNAISPGGISRNQPKQFQENYIEKTPLNRMATEEDLIGAMMYLASDSSRYVTSQNIIVDGGWSVW